VGIGVGDERGGELSGGGWLGGGIGGGGGEKEGDESGVKWLESKEEGVKEERGGGTKWRE